MDKLLDTTKFLSTEMIHGIIYDNYAVSNVI